MNTFALSAPTAAVFLISVPFRADANPSVWNNQSTPALPYQYIESAPVSEIAPLLENDATYASDSLYKQLYPSINEMQMSADSTNGASMASKTRDFLSNSPRGILSSSYLQEYAYIDTYTNNKGYEEVFNFPSIRMNLATPRFGNGLGGGYQPLQFGFGPAAFRFW